MKKLFIGAAVLFASFICFAAPSATPDLTTTQSDQSSPSQELSASKVKQDVLNRFTEVLRQKNLLLNQFQNELAAAKNDLAQCDKLSGNEKSQCLSDANNRINADKQKISDVTYDINTLQKEIKDINGS